MSIRDQAAADYRSNLIADGDPVILTDTLSTEYQRTGKVMRTSARVDPQSGQVIDEPKTVVTVPLSDLPSVPTEGWTAEITDSLGNLVSGNLMSPRPDKTLSFVTFSIEDYKEVV